MANIFAKVLRASLSKTSNTLCPFILGKHPNNTICSFNYHNVSHINKFLSEVQNSLEAEICLVDVGAGKSPYYSFFSSKVSEYIAVDMEASLPKVESRNIRQVAGFAEEIPLENSIADVVLSNQVLEHVNDPVKTVSEIYRLLKPNGKFIGSVPHISSVHLEPYDYRRYTDFGVEQLLKDAGFTNIRIDQSGGVYSATALMIAMDWMLTPRIENEPQGFSMNRALLLAPIVGFMNVMGLLLDKVTSSKKRRSFANLCWIAEKPIIISLLKAWFCVLIAMR